MARLFPAWLAIVAACGGGRASPGAPDAAVTHAPDAAMTQAPDAGVVESLLAPVRASSHLPALAGAVFSSDGLLATGAVGVRKLGDPTPVTRDDLWHLGSDTKAMTATVVALLVADGVLGWDTTIADAFPAEAATFAPAYRPVTIAQLLRHRGGAPADVPAAIWSEMWKPGDPPAQRRAAVLAMLRLAPETPPGTAFVYSNAGFMMAGAMAEARSGKTWEELMRARLFTPLGMGSCGFGAPASPGKVDEPWGHTAAGVPVDPAGGAADNPPSLGPAGTVHCSLADWGKFLVAHLRGARGLATPLALDAAAWKHLHTPPAGESYAYGWDVTSRGWAGGTVLDHSGSNTMFFCTVWLAPAIDRVFVAATNQGGDGAAAGVDAAFGPLIGHFSGP